MTPTFYSIINVSTYNNCYIFKHAPCKNKKKSHIRYYKETKHTKIICASPWKIHKNNKIDAFKRAPSSDTHRNLVWAGLVKTSCKKLKKTPWKRNSNRKKSTLMSDSRCVKISLPPEKNHHYHTPAELRCPPFPIYNTYMQQLVWISYLEPIDPRFKYSWFLIGLFSMCACILSWLH